ncbi:hypothetical protein Fmac_021517 [Flemingia macrophylla]|uniref:Uncharacterized protein n=1 Tax=Flemingia macrophylla TaxID=520843 RepID=A0ABD1LX61_9FABA
MGFRLSGIRRASFTAIQAALKSAEVPKGCLAVYVGENQKRFILKKKSSEPNSDGTSLYTAHTLKSCIDSDVDCSWNEGWFKYDIGITKRFSVSPTYTAIQPFGACADFEAVNDALRIAVAKHRTMGFHLPGIRKTSFAANQASSKAVNVPKGHVTVYVGEKMKRNQHLPSVEYQQHTKTMQAMQHEKILPVVRNQHLLHCTLLIGNAATMEALPVFVDSLVTAWGAI